MSEEVVQETVERKPRKKRVPKAKPPKKQRVSMGGIQLIQWDKFSGHGRLVIHQPPAEIANDALAVAKWAAQVPDLSDLGDLSMVRTYNAVLKVVKETKIRAGLVIVPEAKDEQVASGDAAVQ